MQPCTDLLHVCVASLSAGASRRERVLVKERLLRVHIIGRSGRSRPAATMSERVISKRYDAIEK